MTLTYEAFFAQADFVTYASHDHLSVPCPAPRRTMIERDPKIPALNTLKPI